MNKLRREKMLETIKKNNIVTIKELQDMFPDVSVMTIHRDLDALEKQGVISKHRGGVKSVHQIGDIEFNVRLQNNNSGKLIMAKKALEFVKPHTSIFLDAGTSTLFLAKQIPDIPLNIVTTSPGIALELCRLHKATITLCGGTLSRNNQATFGNSALEMLNYINIDTAFIGVSGCSLDAGFTCGFEGDMLVKKTIIKKARKSVIMCTEEKLKSLMPFTFANMEDIDFIISDNELPEEYKIAAKNCDVTLL